jgi:hypothetical protein
MRWLKFLSKLSFICGIFFLLSVSLLVKEWIADPTTASTIITIGYTMGIIVIPLTVLIYAGVLIARKKLSSMVPLWLVLANCFFLLALIYFIFYLNDPYYHQK